MRSGPLSDDMDPCRPTRCGEAIVYTRYDAEKTVAIHPNDFHRLVALDEDLTALAAAQRIPLSDLALEGLRAEATPGEAIDDPVQIEEILGL